MSKGKNFKWHVRFLRLAKEVSTWSKDPSTKAGAIIVRPDRSVVSVGFNGFPKKFSDDDALYADRAIKYSRIIHCEENALIQAKTSVDGCTLYTWPFICCDRCAVSMIQAGIERFVFPSATEDALSRWKTSFERTVYFLHEADVDCVEIPKEEIE